MMRGGYVRQCNVNIQEEEGDARKGCEISTKKRVKSRQCSSLVILAIGAILKPHGSRQDRPLADLVPWTLDTVAPSTAVTETLLSFGLLGFNAVTDNAENFTLVLFQSDRNFQGVRPQCLGRDISDSLGMQVG